MAYIDMVQHEEAEGKLKDIYDDLVKSRGKLAEIHKIQSLNPETIIAHMELYMSIMFGKSPLKRYQREMIAVVVSMNNGCRYCTKHHAEALGYFWKDDAKIIKFIEDYRLVKLNEKDLLLCDFAKRLTLHPGDVNEENHLAELKRISFTDREILDATLVVSYFNFVNRIVMGLGVELEANPGGYNYK